ncbi:hypothetical protein J6590_031264 [Homalodisca vitripennis]|nr:hypothetical protein J6590_031264 [Homalodisca vitripennis]
MRRVLYVYKEGMHKVPTGDYLGEMTDELSDYSQGSYIMEFVSGGPKTYAYLVWSTNKNALVEADKRQKVTVEKTMCWNIVVPTCRVGTSSHGIQVGIIQGSGRGTHGPDRVKPYSTTWWLLRRLRWLRARVHTPSEMDGDGGDDRSMGKCTSNRRTVSSVANTVRLGVRFNCFIALYSIGRGLTWGVCAMR